MEAQILEYDATGPNTFPCIRKNKKTGLIVLFTGKQTGTALNSDSGTSLGFHCNTFKKYDDYESWEIVNSITINFKS